MGLGEFLSHRVNAQVMFGGRYILWREIIGNLFGLASTVGGMRRRLWAWPVVIWGFTVWLRVSHQDDLGGDTTSMREVTS